MKSLFFSAILFCLFVGIFADLYMQNPRGSNNRNREENTNRNNDNRLFDSQNNAKGGYCRGKQMEFYEGSMLSIEWTNQHGCGNPKLVCNLVIQYMCGSTDETLDTLIRDGTTTETIPDDLAGVRQSDPNGEPTFGMHESYAYYQECKNRQRNMGLFIADRESEGGLTRGRRDSRFTRQQNNADRSGFECEEESEYYPYWAPTPWRDIVIFAQNTDECGYYKRESQNGKDKPWCEDLNGDGETGNYEGGCNGGDKWNTEENNHKIGDPDCLHAPFNRDNHLGNTISAFTNHYNWTLPSSGDLECIKDNKCACVLRMRYNISTADLGENGNNIEAGFVDWNSNGDNSPVHDDEIKYQDELGHQLALDTTQFGRTFQDRSHTFKIRPRPDNMNVGAKIYNLNVRGKRGNIVETYPATEYDFAPSFLHVFQNDYIHFQWTGCDKNPAGNAGEGTDQTDRSNFVQISGLGTSHPATNEWLDENTALFPDQELRKRMAYLDQEKVPGNCLSYEQLLAQNGNNQNDAEEDVQNCMKLNAAEPYFDGGAVRMNSTGTFYYMSSRNNNFSNRGQKGVIIVGTVLPIWAIILVVLGCVACLAAAGIGAATWYARSHPHSPAARFVQSGNI